MQLGIPSVGITAIVCFANRSGNGDLPCSIASRDSTRKKSDRLPHDNCQSYDSDTDDPEYVALIAGCPRKGADLPEDDRKIRKMVKRALRTSAELERRLPGQCIMCRMSIWRCRWEIGRRARFC